nr:MAG TPA: hypothetical protein [Caudoviricetes sp.]
MTPAKTRGSWTPSTGPSPSSKDPSPNSPWTGTPALSGAPAAPPPG